MSRPGYVRAIDCDAPAPVLTASLRERLLEQRPDPRTLATLARLRRTEAAA